MVGQFHLDDYKWTTPRLFATQSFLLTTTSGWTLSVLSIYIDFEGFLKLDLYYKTCSRVIYKILQSLAGTVHPGNKQLLQGDYLHVV